MTLLGGGAAATIERRLIAARALSTTSGGGSQVVLRRKSFGRVIPDGRLRLILVPISFEVDGDTGDPASTDKRLPTLPLPTLKNRCSVTC